MALIGHNTVYLLPTADVGTNNFVTSTGTDHFDLVDDHSTSTYISRTNGTARTFDFTFSDITEASETDITIDNVSFEIFARCISTTSAKSDSVTLTMKIQDSDGTDRYAETVTFEKGFGPHTLYGTARTTHDGSTAWDFTKLNDLRLHGQWTADNGSGDETLIVYRVVYNVRYTYDPDPVLYTTDDNVILKNGLIELKNGLLIIK